MLSKKTTITATFADNTTVSRRTQAEYTHASRKRVGTQAGRGATVRFHTSEEAARAAAGRYGEVVRTDLNVGAPVEPEGDTWVVHYADGETREVTPDVRLSPMAAGRVARPEVPVTRATRKHA